LDPELLDQASEAGIDVTTNLNAFLRDQIRKARADRWLKENREALDDANAFLCPTWPEVRCMTGEGQQ
jgi:post-segregation antitoxin (ccd killing protein)